MKSMKPIAILGTLNLLLSACSLGGMGGPFPGVPELVPMDNGEYHDRGDRPPVNQPRRVVPAPPQIVYRIDEKRHFDLVPGGEGACTNADYYYTDETLGIHTFVVQQDAGLMGEGNFTIDAANDQYLIGPLTRGNTDCSSGGGGCGGTTMRYSTDAGRTWERIRSGGGNNLLISGPIAYDYGYTYDKGAHDRTRGRFLDITEPEKYAPRLWVPLTENSNPNWTEADFPILSEKEDNVGTVARYRAEFNVLRDNKAPKIAVAPHPRKPPLDDKFHCIRNGKE